MNTGRKGGGGSDTPDGSPCKPQAGERLYAGLRRGEAGRVRRNGDNGGDKAMTQVCRVMARFGQGRRSEADLGDNSSLRAFGSRPSARGYQKK
jgi:hypothetical protein